MIKRSFTIILFSMLFANSFCQINIDSIIVENKQFRVNLNFHYLDSIHSPLTEKHRKEFDSLPFFPIDASYYIMAKLVKIKKGKKFQMKTSTNRKPDYRVFGKAVFTVRDTVHELMIYQNVMLIKNEKYKDFLFLPFTDFTNGNQTYGGGRYLDLRIPKGDSIIIDFNKAYNPYCAYTNGYSCPIPPKENALSTYIFAGVKFDDFEH
jgi:uncharacterized protein